MLLLAIPVYAAPFVVISVIGCGIFLAVPRLRRYAAAAFVVPMAFGGCAAAGFISWFLIGDLLLKVDVLPIAGPRGVLEGLAFFIAPGVLGSAAAVWVVNWAVRVWHRLPIAPSWIERTSAVQADY